MSETTFKVSIWELMEFENINAHLDEHLEKEKVKGYAADIQYKCMGITEDGELTVKANFILEDE